MPCFGRVSTARARAISSPCTLGGSTTVRPARYPLLRLHVPPPTHPPTRVPGIHALLPSPAPNGLAVHHRSRPRRWVTLADDWRQLELVAGRERGWSVERLRVGADQYEVKACYSWQPVELDTGGSSWERPLEEQRALLARANAASHSAVSNSLKRPRAAAEEAPAPVSAEERERNARRVVARNLWMLARQTKTCMLDDLLERVRPPSLDPGPAPPARAFPGATPDAHARDETVSHAHAARARCLGTATSPRRRRLPRSSRS